MMVLYYLDFLKVCDSFSPSKHTLFTPFELLYRSPLLQHAFLLCNQDVSNNMMVTYSLGLGLYPSQFWVRFSMGTKLSPLGDIP